MIGPSHPLAAPLGGLCARVAESVDSATEALLQAEPDRAEAVVADRADIEDAADDCEARAYALLTAAPRTAEPGAAEPRDAVTAISLAADLRAMARIAARIADAATRDHRDDGVPEEVEGHIAEMGRICATRTELARALLAAEAAGLSAGPRQDRDALDGLHRHLLAVLLDGDWRHGAPAAVELALLARDYDRFARLAARLVDGAARLAGCAQGPQAPQP